MQRRANLFSNRSSGWGNLDCGIAGEAKESYLVNYLRKLSFVFYLEILRLLSYFRDQSSLKPLLTQLSGEVIPFLP